MPAFANSVDLKKPADLDPTTIKIFNATRQLSHLDLSISKRF